jgi:hypothetical protein
MIFIFAGFIQSMSRHVDSPFVPLLFAGFYFFMIADAYRCAKRINEMGGETSELDVLEPEKGQKSSFLFWGLVLIVLGVLLQLYNLGYGSEWIFKLWPVIVIVIGFRVIYKAVQNRDKN